MHAAPSWTRPRSKASAKRRQSKLSAAHCAALSLLASAQLASVSGAQVRDSAPAGDDRVSYVASMLPMPGQERVDPALARHELVVNEYFEGEPTPIWSQPVRTHGFDSELVIAPDGRTVIQILTHLRSRRPLFYVFDEGSRSPRTLSGEAIDIEGRWLEATPEGKLWRGAAAASIEEADSAIGLRQRLRVSCRDGSVRLVDLNQLGPFLSDSLPGLQIDPACADRKGIETYVQFVRGPNIIRADQVLELWIEGHHPQSGLNLVGFEMQSLERSVELWPCSFGPRAGFAAQVLTSFKGRARLSGFDPGPWTIQVQGNNRLPVAPHQLRVLPVDLVLRLETWVDGQLLERTQILERGMLRSVRSARNAGLAGLGQAKVEFELDRDRALRRMELDQFKRLTSTLSPVPENRGDPKAPTEGEARGLIWFADGKLQRTITKLNRLGAAQAEIFELATAVLDE